ncbi:MAG: hypothetical protein Unbinned4162contig1001_70 [Prokaryotic dsDNA virus sp.]|nr:MAG: hypothetical protein Unbinned4162contig1001_70 [Prokaryotic dsDNA virus sp.]|tara:strand:- start:38353 stop:40002 length:1650 start_codon:yes stop_codon:yes gene_type:complete
MANTQSYAGVLTEYVITVPVPTEPIQPAPHEEIKMPLMAQFSGNATKTSQYLDQAYAVDPFWDNHMKGSVFVSPSLVDLGSALGTSEHVFEVWLMSDTPEQLVSIGKENDKGMVLDGPAPGASLQPYGGSLTYTLRVGRSTDRTINAQFSWFFSQGFGLARVVGERLVIWPFITQGEMGDSYEYLTDVVQAQGFEERTVLRKNPRNVMSTTYHVDDQEFSAMQNVLASWTDGDFAVGYWEQGSLITRIEQDATLIEFDTSNGEYEVDGYVLIYESPFKAIGRRVLAVTPTGIEIDGVVPYPMDYVVIAPARFARALQGASISNTAFGVNVVNIDWTINNFEIPAFNNLYPEYQGVPVIDQPSVMRGTSSRNSFNVGYDVVANGLGPSTYFNEFDYHNHTQTLAWEFDTYEDVLRLRAFFAYLKGKAGKVLLPTHTPDLELVVGYGEDASSTTMTVKNVKGILKETPFNIFIKLRNGDHLIHPVTGVQGAGENEVLIVDRTNNPLNSLEPVDVAYMCYINPYRSASDRLELSMDGNGNTRASLNMRSTND